MSQAPKTVEDATNQILNAWQTLAPTATFAGLTLAQYQAKVQPSFDARTKIAALEDQTTSALDARDVADKTTNAVNLQVVNGVKGDPKYGDDSDLYDAMGYVRKSDRASGLSRRGPTATATAAAKKAA